MQLLDGYRLGKGMPDKPCITFFPCPSAIVPTTDFLPEVWSGKCKDSHNAGESADSDQ